MSVIRVKLYSKLDPNWINTRKFILEKNHLSVKSVIKPSPGRPTCNSTSAPTRGRSPTPARGVGDVSPTCPPSAATAAHTAGSGLTAAAIVTKPSHKQALCTTTRGPADKGKV